MKFLVALACIVAVATASCPTTIPIGETYGATKCNYDLVFSGTLRGGSSSTSQDGPYFERHRTDKFEVLNVYKGNLDSNAVTIYAYWHSGLPCSQVPYHNASMPTVVFAMKENVFNTYEIVPCTVNPPLSCVNESELENYVCPDDEALVA